jgi:small-conductance mechanosensitive channel
MEKYQYHIIQTIAVLAFFLVIQYINNNFINRTLKRFQFPRDRRKIIVKVLNLLTFIIGVIVLTIIWSVKQSEIAFFITSIITVLGIAFFAQWSLLSNITSGIILFFNHPLKIGDTIEVIDKEIPTEGEITDITYFFIHIKTKEGEDVTLPNAYLLQKPIKIKKTGK